MWAKIIYPFPNIDGAIVEILYWIIPLHTLLGMWFITYAVIEIKLC